MAKSFFRLLMKVNHDLVANFNVTNMSFNVFRENRILAKISEFTVHILPASRAVEGAYDAIPIYNTCNIADDQCFIR